MANETTSTTYADNGLAYVLGDRVLSANLPKIVVTGLVNEIDISGEPSDTARLNFHTDLGAPSTPRTKNSRSRPPWTSSSPKPQRSSVR
jgi:hypothetical protein